jgi:hypothetical protein
VTSTVTPWPHQVRAFRRLYDNWPPKLLIADEVGLGKTVEAGLLLRQAWLARRARRTLILAPKNVCSQWQIELREKFNLNWPIYDGQKLSWYPSPAMQGRNERVVSRETWHQESIVIAFEPPGAPRRPAEGIAGSGRALGPRDPRRSSPLPEAWRRIAEGDACRCGAPQC